MVNSPEPKLIEERFGQLFEAARMLLTEKVTEEERIIPTLAFANDVQLLWTLQAEKKRLVAANGDPKAWEREAEMFAWEHPGLRPVEIAHGTLLLERLPVYVYLHNPVYAGEWDAQPTAKERARMLWDMEVVIAVYPHTRPASSERVADLYERTLSAAGDSSWDSHESRTGSMCAEYREDHLLIVVEHADKTVPAKYRGTEFRKPKFPLPAKVGEHYELLMGKPSGAGFARHLTTRKRGPAPEAVNMVAACVAFHLRTFIESPKEIHRVLNEHVLGETRKSLPEAGYSSSETNQLWRDVEKLRGRLLAASHPLHSSEPEWITSHNRFLEKNLF
jgi:hypothetical protein